MRYEEFAWKREDILSRFRHEMGYALELFGSGDLEDLFYQLGDMAADIKFIVEYECDESGPYIEDII